MDTRVLEGLAVASHNDSPAVVYERLEGANQLHRALAGMSTTYQAVVRLRDLHELRECQEISVSTSG
jgi:DNA-directed RNA polymerase specialized sigma24 family protein